MKYALLPFIVCAGLMGSGLHYATESAEAEAAHAVAAAVDAGVTPDVLASAVVSDAPPVDIARPLDPIDAPVASWAAIQAWFARAKWMGIALALYLGAFAYRRRMQPTGKAPDVGWRGMSIAIASALVAFLGPLVEVGTGTGSWSAVMLGFAMGVGLVLDRVNPAKGSATK